MVHRFDANYYSPEDLDLLYRAYDRARHLLGRDRLTQDEIAEQLARAVLKLFDCGVRDEWAIAVQAREAEYARSANLQIEKNSWHFWERLSVLRVCFETELSPLARHRKWELGQKQNLAHFFDCVAILRSRM